MFRTYTSQCIYVFADLIMADRALDHELLSVATSSSLFEINSSLAEISSSMFACVDASY